MKNKFLILIAGLVIILSSCNEEQGPVVPDPTAPSSSSISPKELLIVQEKLQSIQALGFGMPSAAAANAGIANGRSGSSLRMAATTLNSRIATLRMANATSGIMTTHDGDTTGVGDPGDENDSTDVEDPWWDDEHDDDPWCGESCATETFVDNEDGSYTYTVDYGEGCEDYGYFMRGKMTETFSETNNTYFVTITYENFGGEDWTMNGTETYSGTWEDNENDSTDYNGTFEWSEDIVLTYIEEDGVVEEVTVIGSGAEKFDPTGATTERADFTYTLNTGEYFSTSVNIPLFYSYACPDNVFVYVSGEEQIEYNEGNNEPNGLFIINYGQGDCDNIVTVTENGETYTVDLSDEWEDEWDDEYDEGDDNG